MKFNKKDWYYRPEVKFLIIKSTFNRETAYLPAKHAKKANAKRMLRVHNVQALDRLYKYSGMFDNDYDLNLYMSVATYENGLPYHYNLDSQKWKTEHIKEMVAYDFFLDIDAPDETSIMFAYDDAKQIKKLFDYEGVPYQVRFSGCGFHFIIPFKFFADAGEVYTFSNKVHPNIYTFYQSLAKGLHDEFSEFIDLSIYDSRRLCKIPYTLAMRERGEPVVCYPFMTDAEFNRFDVRDMRASQILKQDLRDRGLRTFNTNGSVKNLIRWVEDNKKWI